MERFTKAKPKVVGRRFLRPSPPRDPPRDGSAQKSFQSGRIDPLQHRDPRPMADPPVQTKTGLTVTRPRRDSASPPVSRSTSREIISRSASSASLLLHPPPASTMGRHGLSRSSGNLATSHPTPSYDHVQSKVRQYIREVKSLPKKELSRSCGNLSPVKPTLQLPYEEAGRVNERPKTAEATTSSTAERQQSMLSVEGSRGVSKRSKSETNLRRLSLDNLQQPLQLSKSSISLAFGNLDHLFESSGEDTARTSIFKPLFKPSSEGDEEVEVCPEDLLALVFQEREGKQETKKVLEIHILGSQQSV